MELIFAETGKIALTKISDTPVDLVIADETLGDMTGLEFIDVFKNGPGYIVNQDLIHCGIDQDDIGRADRPDVFIHTLVCPFADNFGDVMAVFF